MNTSDRQTIRVAFQGEPGAFSEAAAIQLLGGAITTVPRATFEAAFTAIAEGAADALRALTSRGEKSAAGIAGRQAAVYYGGVILAESIQDNAETFTRFVLLIPVVREGSDESADSATASSPAVADLMVELKVRRME